MTATFAADELVDQLGVDGPAPFVDLARLADRDGRIARNTDHRDVRRRVDGTA